MPSKKKQGKGKGKGKRSNKASAAVIVQVNSHNKRKTTTVKKGGGEQGGQQSVIPFPIYIPQQPSLIEYHRQPYYGNPNSLSEFQMQRPVHDTVREQTQLEETVHDNLRKEQMIASRLKRVDEIRNSQKMADDNIRTPGLEEARGGPRVDFRQTLDEHDYAIPLQPPLENQYPTFPEFFTQMNPIETQTSPVAFVRPKDPRRVAAAKKAAETRRRNREKLGPYHKG